MKNKKARVGIIGVGEMGYIHYKCIKKLNDLFELVFVCDSNNEKLARITDCYYKTSDWNDIRERLEFKTLTLDGIIIATPSELHFPMAANLSLNTKILVEKPVCLGYEDCTRLNDNVMAGHTMVYNAAISHIRENIANSDFMPVRFYMRRWNKGRPTIESALWRLAPHDISIFFYIMSAFKEKFDCLETIINSISDNIISRESHQKHNLIWNDSIDFSIRYSTDMFCNISVSREAQIVDRSMVIVCDDLNGNYKVYKFDEMNKFYAEYINGEQLPISYGYFLDKEDSLTRELRSFYLFMMGNTNPPTDSSHFRKVGAILQNVEDSIEILKLKDERDGRRMMEFE